MQPRSAFTLIKLLVVIAITAVLAAILLPVVGTIREKADSVVSVNSMKQVGSAMALVASENNYYLPSHWNGTAASNWFARVSSTEYGTTVGLPTWMAAFGNKTATKKANYKPTTDISRGYIYSSPYGMNALLKDTKFGGSPYVKGSPDTGAWSSLRLDKVAGTVVLGDTFIRTDGSAEDGSAGAAISFKNKPETLEGISYRHPGKKAALLFGDWHIQLVTQAEVEADNGKWFDPTK